MTTDQLTVNAPRVHSRWRRRAHHDVHDGCDGIPYADLVPLVEVVRYYTPLVFYVSSPRPYVREVVVASLTLKNFLTIYEPDDDDVPTRVTSWLDFHVLLAMGSCVEEALEFQDHYPDGFDLCYAAIPTIRSHWITRMGWFTDRLDRDCVRNYGLLMADGDTLTYPNQTRRVIRAYRRQVDAPPDWTDPDFCAAVLAVASRDTTSTINPLGPDQHVAASVAAVAAVDVPQLVDGSTWHYGATVATVVRHDVNGGRVLLRNQDEWVFIMDVEQFLERFVEQVAPTLTTHPHVTTPPPTPLVPEPLAAVLAAAEKPFGARSRYGSIYLYIEPLDGDYDVRAVVTPKILRDAGACEDAVEEFTDNFGPSGVLVDAALARWLMNGDDFFDNHRDWFVDHMLPDSVVLALYGGTFGALTLDDDARSSYGNDCAHPGCDGFCDDVDGQDQLCEYVRSELDWSDVNTVTAVFRAYRASVNAGPDQTDLTPPDGTSPWARDAPATEAGSSGTTTPEENAVTNQYVTADRLNQLVRVGAEALGAANVQRDTVTPDKVTEIVTGAVLSAVAVEVRPLNREVGDALAEAGRQLTARVAGTDDERRVRAALGGNATDAQVRAMVELLARR
jgi:hypothetical protein